MENPSKLSPTSCIIVLISTAIVWRVFHPVVQTESLRAQRKAKWIEEKKVRKQQDSKPKKKNQKNQISHDLWTVPEDGHLLSNATLTESIRLIPATLLKSSRSNDKLFSMGESAINNHKTSYIYVIGGRLRGRTLTFVERFNLTTYVWEKCPYLKENRGSHGAGFMCGEVYAVGGGGLRSNLSSTEKMKVRSVHMINEKGAVDAGLTTLTVPDGWQPSVSISVPRHALSVVSVPNSANTKACLYAIGGWCYGSEGSNLMEQFDGVKWSRCCSLEKPRRLHGACYCPLDGCVYVFGGSIDDDGMDSHSVECFIPSMNKWESRCSLPVGACCAAATVGDRYIYVALFGRGMLRYDPMTDSYCSGTTITPLPLDDWHGFSMVAHGRDLFLLGGIARGKWTSVVFRCDTTTGIFEALPPMAMPRRRSAAVVAKEP